LLHQKEITFIPMPYWKAAETVTAAEGKIKTRRLP